MLRSMEKNKKYIFWMVTFGLVGLLLAPVVMYIIKVSKRYPKAFGGITVAIYAFICIYGFVFKREWAVSFVPLCICMIIMAIGRVLDTNSK